MSRSYIDPRFWDVVRGLSEGAQLMWLALLSHQNSQLVPGLFSSSVVMLADERQLPVERVREHLIVLFDHKLVQYDDECRLFRVPRAPKFFPKPGRDNIRGWWRHWQTLPDSQLKYDHVQSLFEVCDTGIVLAVKAWNETFATISSPVAKRMDDRNLSLPFGGVQPSPNPLPHGVSTLADPERDRERDRRSGSSSGSESGGLPPPDDNPDSGNGHSRNGKNNGPGHGDDWYPTVRDAYVKLYEQASGGVRPEDPPNDQRILDLAARLTAAAAVIRLRNLFAGGYWFCKNAGTPTWAVFLRHGEALDTPAASTTRGHFKATDDIVYEPGMVDLKGALR